MLIVLVGSTLLVMELVLYKFATKPQMNLFKNSVVGSISLSFPFQQVELLILSFTLASIGTDCILKMICI